jgi:hypothetical protein
MLIIIIIIINRNHSKFVVICGQKLVYIGESLQRNLNSPKIKEEIIKCLNNLCDSLKQLVLSTKKAALNFPQQLFVQLMSKSLNEVILKANNLEFIVSKYN